MPDNEYPEQRPEREPDTEPRIEIEGAEDLPDFVRAGLEGMVRTVGREANHRMLGQLEKRLAHAEGDEEENEAGKVAARFIHSLTTSELRDLLGWSLASAARHHREEERQERRIWRFVRTTAKDPGTTVIAAALAILIGAATFGARRS